MTRADLLRTLILAPLAALFGRRAAVPANAVALDTVGVGCVPPGIVSELVGPPMFLTKNGVIFWSYEEDPKTWRQAPHYIWTEDPPPNPPLIAYFDAKENAYVRHVPHGTLSHHRSTP